jgi:hypothetical protein
MVQWNNLLSYARYLKSLSSQNLVDAWAGAWRLSNGIALGPILGMIKYDNDGHHSLERLQEHL